MTRFLLPQPLDSMSTTADLYPEGCKFLRELLINSIRHILLAIVWFSDSATRNNESKDLIQWIFICYIV